MNAARLSHDRMQTRFARATWLLDLAPDRPYQVLAYDEQTQKHLVRYSADAYECQEKLSGPPIRGPDGEMQEASPWRHVIKTTARGAASKAAHAAASRAASGFVPPPPPQPMDS